MISFFSQLISSFINAIADASNNFWQAITLSQYSAFQVALDIILVAVLFYWLFMLIRGTRATNIVFGFLVLALVFALSRFLKLLALGWLLDRLLTVVLVAIPVIFQQELRRGLEKLGKTKFFLAQEAKEIDFMRSQVIEAAFEMAEKRIGALIVFKAEVSLKEYSDTGINLGARTSKELLLSLFAPGSLLHDGAVIIDKNRIVAAGCVLPHSFKEYGHKFGTRHKAALGLSEITDAQIIVVSEQRGSVSFVSEGEIQEGVSAGRLQKLITELLAPKGFFSRKKREIS